MNKKDLIICNLEKLKKNYLGNDKKWNLRSLTIAIENIKNYNEEIISGDQMKNEIKGIGEKISKRIDEILKNGYLKELDFSDNQNNSIENILQITGVGMVTAKKWVSLGITNIENLKSAINENKIKITHHINIGIKYYEDLKKKIPRQEIDKINSFLSIILKEIDNELIYEICGSYRRGLLESGDIDILISNPKFYINIDKKKYLQKIVKKMVDINFIIDKITLKGNTKFMGICKLNNSISRRIDIRVVDYCSYYTSLLYFTGNKNFNIYLRNLALNNNYSINEYFITDNTNNNLISLNNEKEIFDILKIPYLIPSERNI